MAKKRIEPDVEVTADGLKVSLGGPYWVLYEKSGWTLSDEINYGSRRNDLEAFGLCLAKIKDWSVIDGQGQPIPFDRAKFGAQVQLMLEGGVSGRAEKLVSLAGQLDTAVHDEDDEAVAALVAQMRVLQKGLPPKLSEDFPQLAIQLQIPLNESFWKALGAARSLPLEQK